MLLRKWNDNKTIDGWEIGKESYRKLDIEQKEKLLIEIAARKFENPKNFVLFDQDDLIKQVSQYLNLSNRSDAIDVLKAIESQHGLLVERADELWSFSHLTFQEYFTTKWLLSLSLEELSAKVIDRRWQKIIIQLVKSQGISEHLIRRIGQSINFSIYHDGELQGFLDWLQVKAKAISNTKDILSAKRSFYFSLAVAIALDITIDFDLTVALHFDLDFNLDYDRSHNLDFARNLGNDFNDIVARDLALDLTYDYDLIDFEHTLTFERAFEQALRDDSSHSRDMDHLRNLHHGYALDLARALKFDLDLNFSPAFVHELQELRADFIGSSICDHRAEWWSENGQCWMERLRQAMIHCYNTGHDWQFTIDQMNKLQTYYDANNFLIGLINIRHAVSPDVRQEIEDNLLLPIAELKRCLPDQYES